jgi:hypothetical protein
MQEASEFISLKQGGNRAHVKPEVGANVCSMRDG